MPGRATHCPREPARVPMSRAFAVGSAAVVLLLCGSPANAQESSWRLVLEQRIGSLDGEATALSRVSGLAVGSDLTTFVAQVQENRIRVFDANGRPLRTIGRGGEGPGEFRMIVGVEVRGDTLLASDQALLRVSRFHTDGRHISTSPFVAPRLGDQFNAAAPPLGHLTDGSMVYRPRTTMMQEAQPNLQAPVVHLNQAGTVIGRFPPISFRGDVKMVRRADRATMLTSAFPHRDLVQVAPDGMAVVYVRRPPATREGSATFSVLALRTPRDTIFHRSYRYPAREVTRDTRDSIQQSYSASLESVLGPAQAARFLQTSGLIPTFHPPVSGLVVADGGVSWIGRETRDTRTISWLRLGPDGAIQGWVQVPPSVRLLAARGDRLWGVQTGEWGEEYVVRYRVVR